MTTHEHEHEEECDHQHARARELLELDVDDDDETIIVVGHVYMPEGSLGTYDHDGCGNPIHDPGTVMLTVNEERAFLAPGQALLLANRLTRAAALVLESGEDPPDIERESARFTSHARNTE